MEFPERVGVQAKKNLPWEGYGYFLKQHIFLKTTLPYNKPWYYFRISNQDYLAWMANSNAGFHILAPTNTMQIQESIDAPAEFYSKVLCGKFHVSSCCATSIQNFNFVPEYSEGHGFFQTEYYLAINHY